MLRTSLVLGLAAGLALGGEQLPLAAEAPTQLAQAEQTILPEGDTPAAGDLEASGLCDPVRPGESVARFHWSPAPDREGRQRVDITAFRDGFERRNFETIAELPASQQSVEWRGAEAGINYYWRVLTLTQAGWRPSAVARFEAPTCPVDFERSDEAPQ